MEKQAIDSEFTEKLSQEMAQELEAINKKYTEKLYGGKSPKFTQLDIHFMPYLNEYRQMAVRVCYNPQTIVLQNQKPYTG